MGLIPRAISCCRIQMNPTKPQVTDSNRIILVHTLSIYSINFFLKHPTKILLLMALNKIHLQETLMSRTNQQIVKDLQCSTNWLIQELLTKTISITWLLSKRRISDQGVKIWIIWQEINKYPLSTHPLKISLPWAKVPLNLKYNIMDP